MTGHHERSRVGIVGARGHTGAELIRLIAGHPTLELAFVSSRQLAGESVADHVDGYHGALEFVSLDADQVARACADPASPHHAQVLVLALPNGLASGFVQAINAADVLGNDIDGNGPVIIDLSADYRFDDDWHYGLPELTRADAAGRRRIANPGCYATAMQLALAPLRGHLDGPAQCFGVSGYSGAGTTPSPRNDPEKLRDNLMPYALVDHIHEREVSRHLGHPVQFMPHVAPWFRGITLTVNLHLDHAASAGQLLERYRAAYADEPLVKVQAEAPWVSAIAGRHGAVIGGFAAQGRRAVVVATLDNLLKGAATQALQNINLALGHPELEGITP
ncbi:MAG: N-acetyl-gamma-glutamyl-phosphate reductase [Xanthomonadales bacterium]|nr:N-acetyl-gamma-glutamyl-phosphate reductase [Xanthomonadales bacterium]